MTIEVSNSAVGGEWPVSDYVLSVLIELCADICRRNNIAKLVYTGDVSGNLTLHNMFAATICPGPYLLGKMAYIASEVNAGIDQANIPSDWAKGAWEKATKAGLVDGQRPHDTATREEVAVIAMRILERVGSTA